MTASGKRNFNSLQIKAQRRFAAGLQTLVSHTWSKSIDTGSSGWFGAENGFGGSSAVQDVFYPESASILIIQT